MSKKTISFLKLDILTDVTASVSEIKVSKEKCPNPVSKSTDDRQFQSQELEENLVYRFWDQHFMKWDLNLEVIKSQSQTLLQPKITLFYILLFVSFRQFQFNCCSSLLMHFVLRFEYVFLIFNTF